MQYTSDLRRFGYLQSGPKKMPTLCLFSLFPRGKQTASCHQELDSAFTNASERNTSHRRSHSSHVGWFIKALSFLGQTHYTGAETHNKTWLNQTKQACRIMAPHSWTREISGQGLLLYLTSSRSSFRWWRTQTLRRGGLLVGLFAIFNLCLMKWVTSVSSSELALW